MIENDPVAGVSFRNTKRHFRKKYGAVGSEGPRVPAYPDFKAQPHVHPRSKREATCGCGYPATPCDMKDSGRNFCARLDAGL